ncbi:hypothetical protein PR048_018096 [Dryococelus australis]|uniref:Uncharacterized protein n=1 Tax=Dryococelus australis TaxID=614101 RepID=A0ABQ9HBC1_9NEOP|nr:hypothetical protein PR048_018096 [Dryococelus australis]
MKKTARIDLQGK